jgi:transposase
MDAREVKACEMTGDARIAFRDGAWQVHSQTASRYYKVNPSPTGPACECDDFALNGSGTGKPCKHIMAVRMLLERQLKGEPNPMPEQLPARLPRATYRQDWVNYNLAQTNEKDHFQTLLVDLCRGIVQPPQSAKGGRPPIPMNDAVFSAVLKVYCLVSARRFMSDLREAHERGHVGQTICFNSVLRVLELEETTPILMAMIRQSSLPLRSVESQFAIDSSGFATSRYVKWVDEKYGVNRQKAEWVKAHLCVGTKTQVVTAVFVDEKNSGDCPQFDPLTRATAENFVIEEMSADKAYLSNDNLEMIVGIGAKPFIPFKSNSLPGGSEVWRQMFHYFQYRREEFLTHYHRRSNVESAFSMIKRKFGDAVRAKTDVAMRNEALAKILCHNVCCCISAWYELKIDPSVWMVKNKPVDEEPRDVLKFPTR